MKLTLSTFLTATSSILQPLYALLHNCPALANAPFDSNILEQHHFLTDHNALNQSQHGFTSGRSTVKNMLHFDATIAAILSKNHAYDVISVDFKKAFDKAPYHHVLEALARVCISNRALQWFGSFRSGRTQQVSIGDCLSSTCDVTSGTVQGSTLGPACASYHSN